MPVLTVVALVTAVVGPIGAYLLAARKMGGKIKTSEASQLWDESRAIREHLTSRLDSASQRASALEVRVAALEQANNALVLENERLRAHGDECDERVKALQITIVRLEGRLEEKEK